MIIKQYSFNEKIKKISNKIVLSFSCDENYFNAFLLMLYSISKQKENEFQVIFIISSNSSFLIKKLEKIKYNNISLDIVVLPDIFYNNFFLPKEKHVSKETYSRYYLFTENFMEFKKILYLDVDLYIIGNLKELWDTNIENHNIAMVQEGFIANSFINNEILPPSLLPTQYLTIYKHFNRSYVTRYEYITQYLNLTPIRYFNNGVLLINVHECISGKLFDKYKEAISKNTFYYPGQDPQNFVENSKIFILSYAYNIIPYFINLSIKSNIFLDEIILFNDYNKEYKNAKIIHYTGKNKPWFHYFNEKYAISFYKESMKFFKEHKINYSVYSKQYKSSKRKYKISNLVSKILKVII